MTRLQIRDARAVVSFGGTGALRGSALATPEIAEDAAVTCEEGVIATVGEDPLSKGPVFDASGCVVVPGFVDCHTHLPFFGWRGDEDAARLSGVRYETLHGRSGGIYRSAAMLAAASDDDVVAFATDLSRAMLRAGTTTFEMKSGYGLSVEAELRQLRLAAVVRADIPQFTAVTCLAAHAVPPDRDAGQWVGEAADELLPRVVSEGLATAVDVYVESIAFALEHAARLVDAAERLGLRMRVHADQLADNQTASFATRWGFVSADHLNHTSPDGVADLAASDTAAVLLPGATFTLGQAARPPARRLVDEGAIVALGSDFNPGTSPIHSMPLVMTLACRTYGLRPVEALGAATVNAAYVLGIEDDVGRISPGRRADLVVLRLDSIDEIAYRPDVSPVVAVVCGGEIGYVAAGNEDRLVS